MPTQDLPTPRRQPPAGPVPHEVTANVVPRFLWQRLPRPADLEEIERRVCVLESALRILRCAPASLAVDRLIEQDRSALRGLGVLA